MSSHHIVRDGQEPALLITSSYFNTDVLFELLGWSPVVMVYKEALQRLLDLDIKLDVIFCEENEREEVAALVQHQAPVKIEAITQNTLPAVYTFMKVKSYKALNIIGKQTIENNEWDIAAENPGIKTVYFTYQYMPSGKFTNTKSYTLTKQNNSKWMAENTFFGVKAMQGATFSIQGNYIDTEEKDMYKTTSSGFISIYSAGEQVIFEEIF